MEIVHSLIWVSITTYYIHIIHDQHVILDNCLLLEIERDLAAAAGVSRILQNF